MVRASSPRSVRREQSCGHRIRGKRNGPPLWGRRAAKPNPAEPTGNLTADDDSAWLRRQAAGESPVLVDAARRLLAHSLDDDNPRELVGAAIGLLDRAAASWATP
jgi:hypothetical protein